MPTFNKGIFEDAQFEAIPTGKFRIISSIFRIYRPYEPGSHFDFKIRIKSINGKQNGLRLFLREKDKETNVGLYSYGKEITEIRVDGISIPGEGIVEYCFDDTFKRGKPEVVASVIASHNDQWTMLIAGILITAIFAIGIEIIFALLQIDPLWHFINPFW